MVRASMSDSTRSENSLSCGTLKWGSTRERTGSTCNSRQRREPRWISCTWYGCGGTSTSIEMKSSSKRGAEEIRPNTAREGLTVRKAPRKGDERGWKVGNPLLLVVWHSKRDIEGREHGERGSREGVGTCSSWEPINHQMLGERGRTTKPKGCREYLSRRGGNPHRLHSS